MAERERASRLGRGMAILAVVLLGAMVVTPAFSAFQPTKSKIKKIAAKQVKKLAPSLTVAAANQLTTQTELQYQAAASSSAQVIFEGGGLKLTATCGAGPALTLQANTSVDNATINSYGTSSDTNEEDFDSSETLSIFSGNEERDVVYTNPSGPVVVLQYAAAEGALYGGAAGCIVKGLAQVL